MLQFVNPFCSKRIPAFTLPERILSCVSHTDIPGGYEEDEGRTLLFHSLVSRSPELSKLDSESLGALSKSDYESASLGWGWLLYFQQALRKC